MTETKPATKSPTRTTREVVEETHERLDVARFERLPRDAKLAREGEWFRDADEVHITERAVALRDSLANVRARVDALTLPESRRPLPEARPPPTPEPAPEPEAPQADLTDADRAALARKVPGRILRVDTLYRTGAGHAVEVSFERDGRTEVAPYILREGKAADLEELGRVLDEIPLPEPREAPAEAAEPAEPPASDEAAAPQDAPEEKPAKKRRFGRKKEESAPDAPAPEDEAPAKRRFGFGRNKKESAEAPAQEAAEAAETAEGEKPAKKRRFGLRRS